MSRAWRLAIPIVCLAAAAWLVFGRVESARFVGLGRPGFVVANSWLNPPSWSHVAQSWRHSLLDSTRRCSTRHGPGSPAIEHRRPDQPLTAGLFSSLQPRSSRGGRDRGFSFAQGIVYFSERVRGAMLFLVQSACRWKVVAWFRKPRM